MQRCLSAIFVALFFTRVLTILSAAEATTFPWFQQGQNAAHTGSNQGPSPSVNQNVWLSHAGGALGEVQAVANGLVFSQTSNSVVALDQATGAVVRSFPVSSPRNLAISGNSLFVGDHGGAVSAFDVGTGSLLWSTATAPINNIVVEGGRVFTNTGLSDRQLRALDAATGNLLWDFSGIAASSSAPTVSGGIVFQNSHDDGRVVAVEASTGSLIWQVTVGVGAARVVADSTRLFFGTQSGQLLALSQTTGATLWNTSLGGEIYAGGTANGIAFAISFSGIVYAVNADTGAVVWSFNTGSGSQSSAVSSADGRVFFSSANGILFALNQSTGELVWSRSGATTPIVADGLVFANTGGEVVAIGAPVPTTTTVGIDIKPGTSPNSINPRNKGVIPVAIIATNAFDPTTVDPSSVRFGRTGTQAAPVHFAFQDVNGDGRTDMILQFDTQETGIVCGDKSASLTGHTISGQAIQGSDSIVTVGCR